MENSYEDTKIYHIRKYFEQCPFLKDGALNVDYLTTNDKVQYTIDTVMGSNPVVKQYMDGGQLRSYPFTFASSEIRSQDVIDQLNANAFYDRLVQWIETNNMIGVLPKVEGAQQIKLLTDGYMFNEDSTSGVYQLQCELIYYKGK